VLIAATGVEPAQIIPYLERNLSPTIRSFDVNAILACENLISSEVQVQCLVAIGAALRRESEENIDLQPQKDASKRPALSIGSVGRICAVTVLGLTVICLVSGWHLKGQRSLVAYLDEQNAALSLRTAELVENPPKLEVDPVLKATVEALQVRLDGQLQLLRALGDQGPSQRGGFSDHLEGFTNTPVPGLWLTSFSIEAGGSALEINGSARVPQLAPQFVERLRAQASFEGFEFQQFHMERSSAYDGVVDFTLSTHSQRPQS
jgi:MSHA biogenesis protein MshI